MTIEDIEHFKIRYNIDKKSRKEYYTFNRMYLYAILFYIHKISLAKIGVRFGTDHATVRNALITLGQIQHTEKFQEKVEMLTDQYYFIVPEYKNTYGSRKKVNVKKKDKFYIKLEVKKEEYIEYLKRKNPEIVYDRLWEIMLLKQKQ